MNVSTLYFLPPIVCCLTVALFAVAAFRKPCGIIHISSCCAHGVLAIDDDRLILVLLSDYRLLPAASRRVLPLHTDAIHSRCRRLEVDQPRVRLVDEFRPRGRAVVVLSQHKVVTGRGELDGAKVSHRLRRVRDDRICILRHRRHGKDDQTKNSQNNAASFFHSPLS